MSIEQGLATPSPSYEQFSAERKDRAYKEELERFVGQALEVARDLGLNPYPVNFQLVPAEIMYEVGSYNMPNRFSHWTHGRDYWMRKTIYDYGLSKIYELVINTDPTQAYLMNNNSLIHNKMVIAHVLAHSDFFRHNVSFEGTNRHMDETMAAHAQTIKGFEFKYGEENVEKLLDAALALKEYIDHGRRPQRSAKKEYVEQGNRRFKQPQGIKTDYDDLLLLGKKAKPIDTLSRPPFPADPEGEVDLLWFIAEFSPTLEEWQSDIIHMVRDEMIYFTPQMKTKIMNEGWATFWHVRIMRECGERGYLTDSETLEFANLHSGVAMPEKLQLNPYWLGWNVFEDINRRFRGETDPKERKERLWFGEQRNPSYYKGNPNYDIFNVRSRFTTDIEFLRKHLNPLLVDELDLYTYGQVGSDIKVTEKKPEDVIQALLNGMANFGLPIIRVAQGGGDYNGNRELCLECVPTGRNLDITYAKMALEYVYRLWGRSVHLSTRNGEKTMFIKYDGQRTTETIV